MLRDFKNTKGFTLAELLLVIFVIALLGTIAISNYVSSTATFKFLSAYKSFTGAFDTARVYAITNKEIEGSGVPDRYGICLNSSKIVVFADVENENPFPTDCGGPFDVTLKTHSFEAYSVSAYEYELEGNPITLSDPNPAIFVFYGVGEGRVFVETDSGPFPESILYLKLESDDGRFEKNVKLYLLTGLLDEYSP